MKNFKVYKSSAGSGKTFTLVKEFLILCLKDADPFAFSKILAITFTNKASMEMKERILKALQEIGNTHELTGTSNFLKHELLKSLKLKEDELVIRCKKTHKAILHNYADFNVSTIDKFSHKLLRTFAKDLDLAINFKVNLEEEELLQQVIGLLISMVGEDDRISQLVISHSLTKVDDGNKWDPFDDILSVAKKLLAEDGASQLKSMSDVSIETIQEVQQNIWKENQAFESHIIGLGKEALKLIDSEGLEVSDFKFGSKGSLPMHLKKVINFEYNSLKPSKKLQESLDSDEWYGGKTTPLEKAKIDKIKGQLKGMVDEISSNVEESLTLYLSKKIVSKNLRLIALLKEIETKFSALKKEQRIVPISDFNKRISDVVLNEPMPFIYEKLGEKYNHIMIDEFQDTSILQFMNLVPLIEESLARGEFNLIVGDAKQAIYRFRGGEVEQFAEMPNHTPKQFLKNPIVKSRLQNLKYQYEEENLNVNYRSAANIVKFNNLFFENIKPYMPERVLKIFENHQQQILHEDSKGYVDVRFMAYKDKVEQYNEQVYLDIQSSLEDGYQYNDIAILCRKKRHATIISEYLKGRNVPILSSESLLLIEMPHINFLIDCAFWINDMDNKAYQKNIIEYVVKSRQKSIGLNDIFLAILRGDEELLTFLKQAGFNLNIPLLQSKTSYEFFESLIRIFNLNKEFDIYLQFFMEAVLNFSQSDSKSVMDFLEWWKVKGATLSIDAPDGMNAVQVLTVHKSKGLEFPIVIYPFAEQAVFNSNHKDLLWVENHLEVGVFKNVLVEFGKEMSNSTYHAEHHLEYEKKFMDLVNDSYVAFTRPTDRLYIRTYVSSKFDEEKPINYTLGRLLKLAMPTNAIKHEFGYSIGEPVKNEVKKTQVNKDVFHLTYHSESWETKLKLGQESRKEEASEKLEARNYGNLFHDIMAKINRPSDIGAMVEVYHVSGQLTEIEAEELKTEIRSIVNSSACKPFFDEESKSINEATLIDKSGKTWRLDRVVFKEDIVLVLDYKTGEMSDSHQNQVKNYMKLVAEMNKQKVKGYLYYIEDKKLQEVFI